MKRKLEAKFAEGLCFKKLFFVFLIGSVIGTIYEDILIYVRTLIETGEGVFLLHRGVIYGPFNVVYGFGAAVVIWLLARKKYNNWQIFFYTALLGGVLEYLISFLQEFFTHTTSWDYSNMPLHINGRTTVPIMLVWGVMGLILVKVIYPWISKWIERIPERIGNTVYISLLVFMVLNMLVSWTAIIRQTLRHNNVPPVTPLGRFYDDCYDDKYLERYFPNMVHQDRN